jgi:hypothetical protein
MGCIVKNLQEIGVVGRLFWRLGWDGVGLESLLGLGSNFEHREPENRYRRPRFHSRRAVFRLVRL